MFWFWRLAGLCISVIVRPWIFTVRSFLLVVGRMGGGSALAGAFGSRLSMSLIDLLLMVTILTLRFLSVVLSGFLFLVVFVFGVLFLVLFWISIFLFSIVFRLS